MKEEWKIIEEYGGKYSVSNMGNIRNNKTKNIMKLNRFKNHLYVNFTHHNKRVERLVSKLVGTYFVNNENHYSIIRHKDNNFLNNTYTNLYWDKTINEQRNKYEIKDNYVIGYTDKNEEFYFDLSDFEMVKKYTWYKRNDSGYIYNMKNRIYLHRFIMNCKDEEIIDHINRNKLDNRKENLRIVSLNENNHNRSIGKNNTSGIIGVGIHYTSKKGTCYRSQITINNKRIKLCTSYNIEDCIVARLKAELEYFGKEFAPQRHLFDEYEIK
jgi:hypothetical protein